MKKAADIVNKEIITIKEDTTFDEVIKIMKQNNIGQVPVISDERISGVVTRDDILIKSGEAPIPPVIAFWDILITLPHNKEFLSKLSKLAGYKASEIMSQEFLTFDIEDNIETIVTRMIEEKINYVIINKDKKFCGIITKSDLINKAF